jgi:hypothetical protein
MKQTEKILALIFVMALALKFMNVPGTSILLTYSLTFLAIIYFYFGFALLNGIRLRKIFKKDSYQGVSVLRIIGAIGLGMIFSLLVLAILFKIQHWLGSSLYFKVGLTFLLIAIIIALFKFLKSKQAFYKNALIRSLIIISISIFFFVIPGYWISAIQFRNYPELVKATKALDKDPTNAALLKNYRTEYDKMRSGDITSVPDTSSNKK